VVYFPLELLVYFGVEQWYTLEWHHLTENAGMVEPKYPVSGIAVNY